MAPMTSAFARGPAGSWRASKKTKSFPDPLILKNSRPNGIMSSDPLGYRPPSQAPDHPYGLANDGLRHLALPLGTIDEYDRDLDDAKVLPPRAKTHLDLEGVAVG